ncbi:class I SAM-dependent methyltransferase [Streptomyces sp. NPDC046261]|uniref:class I SAM-dependent methyltransferase n=1 Tax=Streptomyces sp. NPDC046261 TaxID=3157200 RepID=UPI0033FE60B8
MWALYYRAAAAARFPRLVSDPMAAKVIGRCAFPFEETFGRPLWWACRYLALRTRFFDQEVRRFLARHPQGAVVALGEGLDTQFWRVDNGRVRWLTVDLPEVIALRRSVLPPGNRRQSAACSALDPRWMEKADPDGGRVLLLAQGLSSYLGPEEMDGLIGACAARFPGATLAFDGLPGWLTALSRRGLMRIGPYRFPPMSFSIAPHDVSRLRDRHPGVHDARHVGPDRVRDPLAALLRYGYRLPVVDRALPAFVRVTLSRASAGSAEPPARAERP